MLESARTLALGCARGGWLSAFAMALVLQACARGKPSGDTTEALTVDTVKPAVVTAPTPDTMRRAQRDPLSTRSSRATRAEDTIALRDTTTRTSVSTKDTAHLGRDSVIRRNPRDPRYQLPTVPRKKPPQ